MTSIMTTAIMCILIQPLQTTIHVRRDVGSEWCPRKASYNVELGQIYTYNQSQTPTNSRVVRSCQWSIVLPGVRRLDASLSRLELPFTTVIMSSVQMEKHNITGTLQIYSGPCKYTSCSNTACLTRPTPGKWTTFHSEEVCFRYTASGATIGINIDQHLAFSLYIRIKSKVCLDSNVIIRKRTMDRIRNKRALGKDAKCEDVCLNDGSRLNTCQGHDTKTTTQRPSTVIPTTSAITSTAYQHTTVYTSVGSNESANPTENTMPIIQKHTQTHFRSTRTLNPHDFPLTSTTTTSQTPTSVHTVSKYVDEVSTTMIGTKTPLSSLTTDDVVTTLPLALDTLLTTATSTADFKTNPTGQFKTELTSSAVKIQSETTEAVLKKTKPESTVQVSTTIQTTTMSLPSTMTSTKVNRTPDDSSVLGQTEILIIVCVVSGAAGILLLVLIITCLCCITNLRQADKRRPCDVQSTLSFDTSLFRMNEYWRHNWLVHQKQLRRGIDEDQLAVPFQSNDDISYLYRQVQRPKDSNSVLRSQRPKSSFSQTDCHGNADDQLYDNIQNVIRRLDSAETNSFTGSTDTRLNDCSSPVGTSNAYRTTNQPTSNLSLDGAQSCITVSEISGKSENIGTSSYEQNTCNDADENVFFSEKL